METGHVQTILIHVAVWMGVTVPVLFGIQYTWLSRWWRNPTGISILALDFCVWLTFALSALRMVESAWALAHADALAWADVGIALAVPVIILYRMTAFELKRRRLRRQDRILLVPSPRRDGNGTRARHRRSGESGAA